MSCVSCFPAMSTLWLWFTQLVCSTSRKQLNYAARFIDEISGECKMNALCFSLFLQVFTRAIICVRISVISIIKIPVAFP